MRLTAKPRGKHGKFVGDWDTLRDGREKGAGNTVEKEKKV